ncbi:glycosyltransferase, partial [Rubrivivax gelatinosus]
MKRVLMIAFHFPPLAGSSGVQRTLRFAQHLPEHGWEPLVLTASPNAYQATSPDLLADVPAGLVVERALAFDTARQLSIAGRYWSRMARPDRWTSWRFDAVRRAGAMIRRHRPDVVWSTYPIATAHVIGARVHAASGLPWVADFRDPMAQDGYPEDPVNWQQFDRIERQAVNQAARSVFAARGAAREYARRYPERSDRLVVIENGYDESSFTAVEDDAEVTRPLSDTGLTVLHSGIVYPSERDPTQLMAALRLLAGSGELQPGALRIRFRASAHDDLLRRLAAEHGVEPFVELMPAVGYREALREMLRADALLVMQASNCNDQVPAKVYEYLRAGRPILALADPAGDTAQTLREAGIESIAPLDDAASIATLLRALLGRALHGSLPRADAA